MLCVLLVINKCALSQPASPRCRRRIPSGCSRLTCDFLPPLPPPFPRTSSPMTWFLILGVDAMGTGKIWFPSPFPTPHSEGGQELVKEKLGEVSYLTQKGDRKKGRGEVDREGA